MNDMETFNDDNSLPVRGKISLTGAAHDAGIKRGYFTDNHELRFRDRKEKNRKKSLRDHRREGRRREW